MSGRANELAAWALGTEQLLFATKGFLGPDERLGSGKALLVRPTAEPVAAARAVQLHPVESDDDWREYQQERIAVEAGFGIGEATARAMVDALRARGDRLGLGLYLAWDEDRLVGAVGRFRLPGWPCARLQEVDVFPAWRDQGSPSSRGGCPAPRSRWPQPLAMTPSTPARPSARGTPL